MDLRDKHTLPVEESCPWYHRNGIERPGDACRIDDGTILNLADLWSCVEEAECELTGDARGRCKTLLLWFSVASQRNPRHGRVCHLFSRGCRPVVLARLVFCYDHAAIARAVPFFCLLAKAPPSTTPLTRRLTAVAAVLCSHRIVRVRYTPTVCQFEGSSGHHGQRILPPQDYPS